MSAYKIDLAFIQEQSPYNPSHFRDRDELLKLVRQKIKRLQSDGVEEQRVLNFWGIQGIGKSWLLRHLRQEYRLRLSSTVERPTCTFFYQFPDTEAGNSPAEIARHLVYDGIEQLTAVLSPEQLQWVDESRETGNLRSFIRLIRLLGEKYVPIVLLDNTEQVEVTDWQRIELELIEPLVEIPSLLLIIAGRRQIPRWRRFEVRRRVVDVNQTRMEPFDPSTVRELVRETNLAPDLAGTVYDYTAGSPLLVRALTRALQRLRETEEQELTEAWLVQKPAEWLRPFLESSEAQLLADIPKELKAVIRHVAALRFYRLEAVRHMLTIAEDESESKPYNYYLKLMRELDQRTEIVWWDSRRRAYVTSPVVRTLINRQNLLSDDASAYRQQHERAIEMYQEWADDAPQTSDEFILELWYHQASLYQADGDDERLYQVSKETLAFALENLTDYQRRHALAEQLKNDQELRDLLPASLHEELTRSIEKTLEEE